MNGSRRPRRSACRWLIVAAVACAAPGATTRDPMPAPLDLAAGWNRIDGGPGTDCAFDTPFYFFARPGAPDSLLVYLEGGGACWSAETCDPEGRPTFRTESDTTLQASRAAGIFDPDNSENPDRGFMTVFVPYCTGDVHLGDRSVTYTAPARDGHAAHTFTVHYNGAANVARALEWTYAHVTTPRVVLVAGSSGGAIPSPFYAVQIARHYPAARVVQLGDAGGGYRSSAVPRVSAEPGIIDVVQRLPGFTHIDTANFTFEKLYEDAARAVPRIVLSQYNAAEDSTQIGFLRLLGVRHPDLPRLLGENLDEIRTADPGFRSYTAPGHVHTILSRPQLYTLTVDGVRFRDWLADLVAGHPVQDVGDSLLDRSGR